MHNSFNAEGDLGQGAARFILQKRQVEVLEKIGERLEKMGKEMNNATIIMSDMVRKLNQ